MLIYFQKFKKLASNYICISTLVQLQKEVYEYYYYKHFPQCKLLENDFGYINIRIYHHPWKSSANMYFCTYRLEVNNDERQLAEY